MYESCRRLFISHESFLIHTCDMTLCYIWFACAKIHDSSFCVRQNLRHVGETWLSNLLSLFGIKRSVSRAYLFPNRETWVSILPFLFGIKTSVSRAYLCPIAIFTDLFLVPICFQIKRRDSPTWPSLWPYLFRVCERMRAFFLSVFLPLCLSHSLAPSPIPCLYSPPWDP